MNEDIYPIEVCCPNCKEVIILIESAIPGSERVMYFLDHCDTPMTGMNSIRSCPVCSSYLPSMGKSRIWKGTWIERAFDAIDKAMA
jgi:hypothetical protein